MKQTALYDAHVKHGAKMVPFVGWDMPLHYGSQLAEHAAVREGVGVFDVSHMGVVDVTGPEVKLFLRQLLANDVAKLSAPLSAQYTLLLDPAAGVIDDLIVYYLADDNYRLIINASRADIDIAWIEKQLGDFKVELTPRDDLALIAVQGPKATASLAQLLPDQATALSSLAPFKLINDTASNLMIARTGYTGEDGFEIALPQQQVVAFFEQLLAAGVQPCGLGARDSLRLEAGFNLYGQDMDEHQHPYNSNLGWVVDLKDPQRNFIGRDQAEKLKAANTQMLCGLVLEGRAILRAGQEFTTDQGPGVVTSGGFSPTLAAAIALVRVPKQAAPELSLSIRNKPVNARLVKQPFVKNNQVVVKELQ